MPTLDNVKVTSAAPPVNVVLDGGEDSDTLRGGAGNDQLIGGVDTGAADVDTVVYANGPTGYAVTFNAGGTVTVDDTNSGDTGGDEGTDTLTGIEVIDFNGTDHRP